MLIWFLLICGFTLLDNLSTDFNNQKLLVIIVANLDTNLQNKKLLITKVVYIINKKL